MNTDGRNSHQTCTRRAAADSLSFSRLAASLCVDFRAWSFPSLLVIQPLLVFLFEQDHTTHLRGHGGSVHVCETEEEEY